MPGAFINTLLAPPRLDGGGDACQGPPMLRGTHIAALGGSAAIAFVGAGALRRGPSATAEAPEGGGGAVTAVAAADRADGIAARAAEGPSAFVGSARCGACHAGEARAWAATDHARA